MKYIFVAGAPGSGWSSIPYYISFSPDIDRSDITDTRKCYELVLNGVSTFVNHQGSYFDPGMEFGNWFDQLDQYSKQECEAEFDRPFSGTGIRIIRSHAFAKHIDFIKRTWPDCPIVLVHRPDEECINWWFESGGFQIPYPSYRDYYKDRPTMIAKIIEQNTALISAWNIYEGQLPNDNFELCDLLEIDYPPEEYACAFNGPDKLKKMPPIHVKVI